jgi:predicted patatin/cPLA2 family phospholipase
MRALVISGGGSKGAFAGGFAQHLLIDKKIKYDMFVGTSTGSLLVPLLSIGKVEQLKKAYTSVTEHDIYNICPFRIKELKDGTIKSSINHFNTLRMFLKRKKTFGETKNLRKTIAKIICEEDFNIIKASGKKVVCAVSNLTKNRVEYKYLRDYSYNDYLDWMWASSSFIPFMSVIEKGGYEYADGGFGNYIPVEEAISAGATLIDVIVLNPKYKNVNHQRSRNAFDIILRSIGFMLDQIAYDDIYIGHLQSIYDDKVTIRFHFTPRLLTEHSFHFDPIQMTDWWDEGYEFAQTRMQFLD